MGAASTPGPSVPLLCGEASITPSSEGVPPSDSVGLVVVGKAKQSDDFPWFVGIEEEDERPDVNSSHSLERGTEGLVVKGVRDNLSYLPVDGSAEPRVPPAMPAVVVLELRGDLERPRQWSSPRISAADRIFRNLPFRIL